MKQLRYFLCISILFVQCTDDEKPRLNGADFFPLTVGKYWVYNVQEIIYSPLQPPSTQTFHLLVHVVDSFPNSENGFTYVLHRYTRPDESSSWQFTETWSARLTDQYVIVSEGNVPVIPLAFPVHLNRKWNANLFNDYPEDEYQITDLITGYSWETPVDVVAKVIQENVPNNLTYRDVRLELYGKDVGLISKISEVWTYTCTGGTCTEVINHGYKWEQTLLEYGTM